jgi:hypothetical protein
MTSDLSPSERQAMLVDCTARLEEVRQKLDLVRERIPAVYVDQALQALALKHGLGSDLTTAASDDPARSNVTPIRPLA